MKRFTTNELEARGYLYRQLEVQAKGLSGNLDKMWPDIKSSKWIGGDKDGWERVPYWLDGFVPLAYLLKDENLIARANKYINAIIDGQFEDGFICPCKSEDRERYDMWPLFLICKVLMLYHECSGDERIESVVYKALKNYYSYIKGRTMFNWASARWFECIIPIMWLYERKKESWLIELVDLLKLQGMDYELCESFWKTPKREWAYHTHVVNIAMALKSQALYDAAKCASGEKTTNSGAEYAKKLLKTLFKYNGTAAGHFTGDECLSGNSPIQGSELCGVVEAMYSYETLIELTNDSYFGDLLEGLAFNALPATVSPDMWTHQYDQMTNQIECSILEGEWLFATNNQDAHNFGLEPNFGCCTANFSQGFPKFALSTFMKTDDGKGIASVALAPSKVTTTINGTTISVELDTLYPFRDKLLYKVECEKEVEFSLLVRIPHSAKSVLLDGKAAKILDGFVKINKKWQKSETVSIELDFDFVLEKRYENLLCLKRGNLVFSLPISDRWEKREYVRDGVERKFPYCDYQIYPTSKWNYAFAGDSFRLIYNEEYAQNEDYLPFSTTNPPLKVEADMQEIDWGFERHYKNVCRITPNSTTPISNVQKVQLQPYGCTTLRMTEMPKVE